MSVYRQPLSTNCYHTNYIPGTAIRLVQFYFDREGQPPLYLTTQDVIALAKVHARYVYTLRIRSVVVIVDEKIIHNVYESGYVASGTLPSTRHLVVAHHQYPTYTRHKADKYRWQVYQLDLRHKGTYICSNWEDYTWVMTQVDKINYRPLRERLLALPPL